MLINTTHPYSMCIRPFQDGVDVSAVAIDTTKREFVLLNRKDPDSPIITTKGKMTFKLEKDMIPEPYLSELTSDPCFDGFYELEKLNDKV